MPGAEAPGDSDAALTGLPPIRHRRAGPRACPASHRDPENRRDGRVKVEGLRARRRASRPSSPSTALPPASRSRSRGDRCRWVRRYPGAASVAAAGGIGRREGAVFAGCGGIGAAARPPSLRLPRFAAPVGEAAADWRKVSAREPPAAFQEEGAETVGLAARRLVQGREARTVSEAPGPTWPSRVTEEGRDQAPAGASRRGRRPGGSSKRGSGPGRRSAAGVIGDLRGKPTVGVRPRR